MTYNEKGEMVLTWDEMHVPWHLIMPGDKDFPEDLKKILDKKEEKK